MRSFFLLIFFCVAVQAYSDTTKLMMYKELFWKHQSSDLSVASSYADSLFELSELIGDKQSLSEAYGCKVIVHIQRADYTEATACLKKQKSLNLELDDELSNATFNNRMGTIHYYQTSLDSALFYWKRALKDYQIYKDDKSAVKMRNNIGVVHFDKGDFEQAYGYYKENQDFYEKNGVKSVALVNCYNNIGLVFKKLNNHEKAKEYYQKSLALVEQKGYEKKKQLVFFNLANIHKIDEDYEKAIDYYEQSLEISKKNGMPIGVLLSSLGECYFHLNQYVKAETCKFSAEVG
jgi:tetratricopeptide (TPR) repeat protein